MDEARTLAEKRDNLLIRARMIQAIRVFFITRDYLEIETPCLTPAPAPEPHIEAFACGRLFLHTSPELYMKRLLAAGYPKLFQICRCFRGGERGDFHLPEFTMLEWYHTGKNYRDLMTDCEDLIVAVAHGLGFGDEVPYGRHKISLQTPWERIPLPSLFARHSSIPLNEALDRGLFDEIMVDRIEPHLGRERPAFIYDYPLSPGSLARTKGEDEGLVERFELYVGGLEVANAFSELTDALEQRQRFAEAERERRAAGKAAYPPAERFLLALETMPEAAGIALGVDRLAMIFTDSPTIDCVVAFAPEFL